ncbi:MAG TPA: sterol desaturase family protein [Tepidisphaeraceae bacterium]|nr:sterol desaturase family protein [Tepidisphaeraceae bacterium]
MPYQVFHPVLDVYGGPILLGVFVLLLILESRRPLRPWAGGMFNRLLTNVGVALPTFAVMRLALIPAVVAAGYWAQREQFGLLYVLPLPRWLRAGLAFLLLDYLLYLWHILSHKVPLLWRLHNVHHTDLDLGVSTAIRFHFGEMLLSGVFRATGVLLIGAGPVVVLVYEVIFEASVAFHHSNWRLPFWLERPLSWLIVTPRMHGIHHSIVRRETDSNYSNLLNVWDRIHRTIRLNVPQDQITIGVPAYRDGRDLTVATLLAMPFRPQKEYWRTPDGIEPSRVESGKRDRLQP